MVPILPFFPQSIFEDPTYTDVEDLQGTRSRNHDFKKPADIVAPRNIFELYVRRKFEWDQNNGKAKEGKKLTRKYKVLCGGIRQKEQ